MELYSFVWGTLAWTMLVASAWPLNVPLAWASYRIWHGNTKPIDEEMEEELWRRSAYGSLAILAGAWALLLIDYVLATWAELPAGLIHMVILLTLIALAAWLMMLFFALEDFFSGLSLLIIYFYLPVFILWLPNRLTGMLDGVLNWFYGWLATPTG